MNRFLRSTAFWLVILLSTFTIGALDVEFDSFALEVVESQGRFSVFAKSDSDRTALYIAEDPTTSYVSVLLDNRIYRLGDSFDFRQSAETTQSGAKLMFVSPRLEVETDIDITGDTAVTVEIKLTNVSETNAEVGLRMLLDTYLGESGVHFSTPDGEITSESEFLEAPDFVFSGSQEGEGLYLDFKSSRASVPDRIILANWKRLNDTSWNYTVNLNRNFSVVPYSINDSAASLYFDPEQLLPGEARTIRIIFSTQTNEAVAGFPTAITSTRRTETTTTGSATSSTSSRNPTQSATIGEINDLILRIDAILEGAEEPTEAELQELSDAVEAMRESISRE